MAKTPMRHDSLQLAETAVEEMFAAGDDYDGQVLRTRPLQDRGERHDIVRIAVHDQRVFGNGLGVEAIHRRCDQGESLAAKSSHDPCLHVRAEGKSGEQDRQIAKLFAHMFDHHDEIVGLAYALVVNALGCTHPTEVRTQRAIPESEECARERGYNLVFASAPMQGMWVCDECDAAARGAGIV